MATQPGSQPQAQRREEEDWGCATCAVKAAEEAESCSNCGSYSFRKYRVSQLRTMGGPVVERRTFG